MLIHRWHNSLNRRGEPHAQPHAPTFGDLLKQLRKRAGMTQGDLAAAVGYSVSFVSVLEQNRRLPDVDAVLQVFVPALGLQDEPHLATRLVELAASARGERPPVAITRQRETQIVVTEAHGERATHLPAAPTDLIGRAQEVRQLCQRLPGHSGRLLTLVGPPGIGKTQLALAVAAQPAISLSGRGGLCCAGRSQRSRVDGGHDCRQRGQ